MTTRMRLQVMASVVAIAATACVNNVPQGKATGKDGAAVGAIPIAIEEQERDDATRPPTFRGEATGIVTYPGGDRVDWKVIALPKEQTGPLELKMTWTPPRPGLRLGFDVFDAKAKPVALVEPGRTARSRDGTIADARGTYFVRIYAEGRGDAGAYKLVAAFAPGAPKKALDLSAYPVPYPPGLPAIQIDKCRTYDASNPDCAKTCHKDAPSGAKGCPPCHKHDAANAQCASVCAADAPATWAACIAQQPPCTVFNAQDPNCASICHKNAPATWPACVALKPLVSRVYKVAVSGNETTVWVRVDRDVTKDWKAEHLVGQGDKARPSTTGRIVSVDKKSVQVAFKLNPSEFGAPNDQIRLTPPTP